MGIVKGGNNKIVKEALNLTRLIANKSPVALTGTKALITHARDHIVKNNLEYTQAWNAGMLMTDDMAENLWTTKAKRKPKFSAMRVDSAVAKLY